MNLGKHKHSDCSKRKAKKEGKTGRRGKCRNEKKEERKKNGRQGGREREAGRKAVIESHLCVNITGLVQ